MNVKSWLPVFALTFAAFIFNTSEFIPIGLLSGIAADFQITEAKAGLLITIYAWVVAIASLPLMLSVSKMEYRKILLGILGLFIGSHLLSAVSTSYTMLMISRMGVACSHSIFWSIAAPLAVLIAPHGHKSTALGFITTGTSVAMIIGMPLGRAIGLQLGWRATFMCIAIVAFLVSVITSVVFPKVQNDNDISLKEVPRIFKNRSLIYLYFFTMLIISSHFTGYSYIEPFMGQVAGFSDKSITLLLTIFGLVGIVGSILFSKYYDKRPDIFIKYAVIGIPLFLMLMLWASHSHTSAVMLCVLWGLAITFYNLAFQYELIRIAPHGTTLAMSVYSGIYNIGIGSGALIGGLVCTHISISSLGYVGGAIGVVAMAFCFLLLLPRLQNKF